MAFKAIIASQLRRLESSFLVWHSMMSVLSYGVQSLHLLQFGVQSRISSLVFRVTIPSQFDVQILHLIQFGVQSRISILVLESLSFHSLTFKALIFFSLAFKATISSQLRNSKSSCSVWHSEMSVLSYGVQSHHLLTAWRSEPLSLLSYDIQSRVSQFDIQRC